MTAPPPPPGSNLEYIKLYEETLKKKEEITRQQAEERFGRAANKTQEEYKRCLAFSSKAFAIVSTADLCKAPRTELRIARFWTGEERGGDKRHILSD